MINKIKQFVILATFALLSTSVLAIPITGKLEMTGALSATVGDDIEALTINFNRSKFITTSADGDFSSVGRFGDIASSLDVIPFSGPIPNFLTIDVFSFELTDLAFIDGGFGSSSAFLTLTGNGILSGNGFANTDAIWQLSAQSSGGPFGGWSATLTAQESEVPEPGMLALLSLGLITMVARRRMIK